MKRSTGVRDRKSLKVRCEQRTQIKAGLGQECIQTHAHVCICMHVYIYTHIKMQYKFVQTFV